jgi:hypothetical protein
LSFGVELIDLSLCLKSVLEICLYLPGVTGVLRFAGFSSLAVGFTRGHWCTRAFLHSIGLQVSSFSSLELSQVFLHLLLFDIKFFFA